MLRLDRGGQVPCRQSCLGLLSPYSIGRGIPYKYILCLCRHVSGPMAPRPPSRLRRPHERPLRHRLPLPRPARQHARLGGIAEPGGHDHRDGGQRGIVRHRHRRYQLGDEHAEPTGRCGGGGGRAATGSCRRDARRLRAADQERPAPHAEEVARGEVGNEGIRSGTLFYSICLA